MLNRPPISNRSRELLRGNQPGRKLDLLKAVELRDRRVARAIYGLPWELFDNNDSVPTAAKLRVLVQMLEALELRGHETVLDVGTGAGYRAALLGSLASQVRSIELVPSVARSARNVLGQLGIQNVEVIEGDGSLGWARTSPYEAIIFGCASPSVPNELIDQLSEGGRLVIPVGDEKAQLIERLCRHSLAVESTTVGPCALKPLAFRGERRASVPWLQLPS
jgi:protein-L-isoaspartate(D-aspartate) O-methyltransferase